MIHICTDQSLRAGIDAEVMDCFICGQKTMYLDWVGCKCDTCAADTAWESDVAGMVRSIRQKTGFTRKQIAEFSGLKQSTIKNYEWCYPSVKYRKWFFEFIKNHYALNQP